MSTLLTQSTWLPRQAGDFVERFVALADRYYARTLDAADLDRWRTEQLDRVLTKVSQRSPFYERHLRGVDVASVTPAGIAALPFTTKDDLRRELLDVLSGDVSEALFFYETTGTTGRATPCPRDAKEIISSNTHVTESWRAIFAQHFGDHRPSVGLMGPTEIHSFGDTLGDVARNVGSLNAKIWPYSPVVGFKRALELMRDLRLEVVVATPGVCLNLARAARHYEFDMERDFASLKLFFVTGEMCTSALAANIDSVWGVTTYNILYGSQEAFIMGVADPSRRMRLTELNYVVEVIDPETGRSLGDRGTGELTVTMLADGIKPLVRYRTGDMVRITDDPRLDGDLPGPTVEVIGRVLDRLVLGGAERLASDVEEAVLTGVRDCYGYQVVIDTTPQGDDRCLVRLELRDSAAPHVAAQTAAIVERFRADLGVACQVDIVDELDAIVSTGAFVSWKAARIADHRREQNHEEQVARQMAQHRGIES